MWRVDFFFFGGGLKVEGKREEEREREKESKRGRERESSANEKKKKKTRLRSPPPLVSLSQLSPLFSSTPLSFPLLSHHGGRKEQASVQAREGRPQESVRSASGIERRGTADESAISMRRRRQRRPAAGKRATRPFARQSPFRGFAPAALIGDAQGLTLCFLWRAMGRRFANEGAGRGGGDDLSSGPIDSSAFGRARESKREGARGALPLFLLSRLPSSVPPRTHDALLRSRLFLDRRWRRAL